MFSAPKPQLPGRSGTGLQAAPARKTQRESGGVLRLQKRVSDKQQNFSNTKSRRARFQPSTALGFVPAVDPDLWDTRGAASLKRRLFVEGFSAERGEAFGSQPHWLQRKEKKLV